MLPFYPGPTPGPPRIPGGAAIRPPRQPEPAHATIGGCPILGRGLLAMTADDPLVSLASVDGIDWRDCPAKLPLAVAGGGHCGFHDRRADALSVCAIRRVFEQVAGGRVGPAATLSEAA